MPCPVTALSTTLKLAGTASLGILVGTSFTTFSHTIPSAIEIVESEISSNNNTPKSDLNHDSKPRSSSQASESTSAAAPATRFQPHAALSLLSSALTSVTTTQSSLTLITTVSLLTAWAISPWRRKHPYLLWTAVFAGIGNAAVILRSMDGNFLSVLLPPSLSQSPSSPPRPRTQDVTTAAAPSDKDDLADSTISFSRISLNDGASSEHETDHEDIGGSIYNIRPRHNRNISAVSIESSIPAQPTNPDTSSVTRSDVAIDRQVPPKATLDLVRIRSRVLDEQTVQTVKFTFWSIGFLTALVGLWGER